MNLEEEIHQYASDPEALETLYHEAVEEDREQAFIAAVQSCYERDPGNLLLAAWFYRLDAAPEPRSRSRHAVNWTLAIPLSILTGLIFWALSDVENLVYLDHLPIIALWWSPIATFSALVFLAGTAKKNIGRALGLGLALFAAAAYVMLLAPGLEFHWKINHYLDLAAIHIPLLCWIALGIHLLGLRSTTEERFAFLIKSIETMIAAGLFLIAGITFATITVGMFAAIGIELPDTWLIPIAAGGFGLLPVLALASVYDPKTPPSGQDFSQGLSTFIATMMRMLLLPLTLVVLVIYLLVIPFHFFEPFVNRDVLIVYNLMLFAVIGMLLGATPIRPGGLSIRFQKLLRKGIMTVAGLAVLVSLYALSATVFRTIEGGLTINRTTIIGWNIINILILVGLVYRQFKAGRENWIPSLHTVFSQAANAYWIWALFIILTLPLLFRW